MGIVNVTPDSFFPDSRTVATVDAVLRGRALFEPAATSLTWGRIHASGCHAGRGRRRDRARGPGDRRVGRLRSGLGGHAKGVGRPCGGRRGRERAQRRVEHVGRRGRRTGRRLRGDAPPRRLDGDAGEADLRRRRGRDRAIPDVDGETRKNWRASPPCGSIRVSDLARRPSTTSRSWPTCRTSWRSRATSTPGS